MGMTFEAKIEHIARTIVAAIELTQKLRDAAASVAEALCYADITLNSFGEKVGGADILKHTTVEAAGEFLYDLADDAKDKSNYRVVENGGDTILIFAKHGRYRISMALTEDMKAKAMSDIRSAVDSEIAAGNVNEAERAAVEAAVFERALELVKDYAANEEMGSFMEIVKEPAYEIGEILENNFDEAADSIATETFLKMLSEPEYAITEDDLNYDGVSDPYVDYLNSHYGIVDEFERRVVFEPYLQIQEWSDSSMGHVMGWAYVPNGKMEKMVDMALDILFEKLGEGRT